MPPDPGLRLPTKLALMVMAKEISLDEGLIKAHTSNHFTEFIQAVHDLMGIDFLDIEFLADRVKTGVCQRALQGQAPLLALPEREELESGLVSETPPAKAEELEPDQVVYERVRAELLQLEERLSRIKNERNAVLVRYQLLESADRNVPSPPDPWAGPTVILLLTFGFVLVLFSFVPPGLRNLFIGMGGLLGLFLSAAAFLKGRKHYRRLMEKYRRDSENRRLKMRSYTDKIEHFEDSLQNIRRLAQRSLEREEQLSPQQSHQLQGEFPQLFKAELLVS